MTDEADAADGDGDPAVTRHHDLRIPVGSDTVAATRYEPTDREGPLPALLMYVPYHKDDLITYGAYDPLTRYLARNGYEVVVADMVGTGASSGRIEEMFVRREGREGAALVEWLADRAWTTGRIGVFGKSYGGITALDAAAQRPDGLEAIVPIHTPYQGYRNGYTYGGLPELLTIQMNWLTYVQALDLKPPSRRDAAGRWADAWRERLRSVREREPWLFQFLDHPSRDDYWADKDIPVERVDVPTLAVGGWRDPYTRDTVEYFDAIDAPKRLLFGPWRHTMPHRGRESAIAFRRLVVEWFDRFLKDEENGALDAPLVRYWTERDGGGRVDGGVWRGRDDWPASGVGAGIAPTAEQCSDANPDASSAPATSELAFALSPRGLVPAEAYDAGEVRREYEVDHTVGLASTDPFGADLPPQDATADDARSCCFETERFDEPVELTGTGEVRLRLRSTTADPHLAVRLLDVAPDGTAHLVTAATLRASCREGLDSSAELTPGETAELSLPLAPTSHLFERGHRLRVAVSGAYFPEVAPAREHGSLTVLSTPAEPSLVRFPGCRRGGDGARFDDTVEFTPPAAAPPTTPERVHGASSAWETARERTDGVGRARLSLSAAVDAPHVDLSRSGRFEAEVCEDDPTSFRARNEQRIVLEYPTERVEVVATNRFSHDTARVTSRVLVDGEPYFEETWTR